jgi:dihydrofolate reductase
MGFPSSGGTIMRTLKYYVACSLNGFIARESGAFDYFVMEGGHGTDWLASFATFDVVLMGRKTYEVGLKEGVTNPYPAMKSYVFSRTLGESPHENVVIVRENAAEVVRDLKQGGTGKDIYLCGGGELASHLFAADLIDEVILKVNPVIVGAGIPLVSRETKDISFEPLDTKVHSNGVVVIRHRVKR